MGGRAALMQVKKTGNWCDGVPTAIGMMATPVATRFIIVAAAVVAAVIAVVVAVIVIITNNCKNGMSWEPEGIRRISKEPSATVFVLTAWAACFTKRRGLLITPDVS